ncbi:globin domain-containing protein [Amycolatopsis sp. NPDC048633]|uniref:globin domain-containing protein n=1 Tax=Amycolatopsis sp. NPDC048633 TaxID=3157095 RepID=UPI0033C554B6
MFADHPELLDLFNRGNQANGDQRRALAGAVVAYAEHATGAGVVAMGSVVGRIAHKHASLGIRPSQYPLVGRYLLTAVATVLGDAVTPGVAAAWDEVYWLMAVRLIETEARLYQEAGVDLADPAHRWRVAARRDEGGDVVSLFLIPVEGTVPPHLPGQFVTVDVDLPGGGRQARQYTVSRAAGHRELRISVRRVRGAGGAPDGLVSTALTRDLRIGDEVRVSHPFGDAVLADDDRPLLLASAGIGITQTAALLEHVARHQPRRPVTVVHAERHPDRYALFHDIEFHGARLTSFRHLAFYDTDAPTDVTRGPVRLDSVDVPDGVTAHLCGPVPFMRDIRAALLARGVSGENVHIEVFGPDLWTTGADRLPGVAAAV